MGSLVSLVAPNVKPEVVPLAPERNRELAKLSLNGPKNCARAVGDKAIVKNNNSRPKSLRRKQHRGAFKPLELRFFNIVSLSFRGSSPCIGTMHILMGQPDARGKSVY